MLHLFTALLDFVHETPPWDQNTASSTVAALPACCPRGRASSIHLTAHLTLAVWIDAIIRRFMRFGCILCSAIMQAAASSARAEDQVSRRTRDGTTPSGNPGPCGYPSRIPAFTLCILLRGDDELVLLLFACSTQRLPDSCCPPSSACSFRQTQNLSGMVVNTALQQPTDIVVPVSAGPQ